MALCEEFQVVFGFDIPYCQSAEVFECVNVGVINPGGGLIVGWSRLRSRCCFSLICVGWVCHMAFCGGSVWDVEWCTEIV